MNAIVTIAVGPTYERIAKLTHPSIRSYAERIEAEFIIIDKSDCSSPHWEKFQIYDLLEQYDRILYLDTDLIIREDCPNLFDIVPPWSLGLFDEAPYTSDRKISLIDACRAHNLTIPVWDGRYFNSGVMVVSKQHRDLFKKPDKEVCNFFEQGYLNALLASSGVPIQSLDYCFNRMVCMDFLGKERHASSIIHYAGFPNLEAVIHLIRKDLKIWKRAAPRYQFREHILIDVTGGLGDQVCAEPAIRYARDHVWQDAEITIRTLYPCLFSHLGLRTVLSDEWQPAFDTPYYQVQTLPKPEGSILWHYLSNLLCHTIDFCAISLLRRTLPLANKEIRLEVDHDAMESLLGKIGENYQLKELVVVNAGRHWEGKTFPVDWWQDVVDGLEAEGYQICLIGLDDLTRGSVAVKAGPGMLDLRNKLVEEETIALLSCAPVLVSNDAGPIHIAGAFDNWIILIPTSKHPDHLLPWRHGSQEYGTRALYKSLMADDYQSAPNTVGTILADKLPPGKHWGDYLPESKEVIEAVMEIML